MKQWLPLALVAALAWPAAAAAREVRLAVGETVILEVPGVTAVFAVDPATVESSTRDGQVILLGRHPGQTVVTVVTAVAVESVAVYVAPRAVTEPIGDRAAAPTAGSVELRYDSATRRLSTGLTMAVGDGERTARLQLFGLREDRSGVDSLLAFPSLQLALAAPGKSLVLLDELVEESPLRLEGTVLRGLHLRQRGFTLHAGIASPTPWEDLLLPTRGDRALGLSHVSENGRLRLTPSALLLPDSGTEVRGVVALGLGRGTEDDALRFDAEIGWSDVPGAAIDLSYRDRRQHGWLEGVHRPAGFAALDVGRPPGSYLDGAWSRRFGERTTADLSISASRLDLAGHRQQASSSRLEVRHRVDARWSLTAGLGAGSYRDRDGDDPGIDRGTLSLGTGFDGRRIGVAALYRRQETSLSDSGGNGGRITAHAVWGPWRAHFFVDAQEQVPTLDLVLQGRPDLARALVELGFVARTPEEVIRLVRDHAALFAQQGVTLGALDLDPLRLQAGFDASWRGQGPRRPELGMRLMFDEAHGLTSDRRTYLATLSASLLLFGDTALRLGYTHWSSASDDAEGYDDGSFELALRTGLTGLPGGGRRPIRGRVVHDLGTTDRDATASPPLQGVEVVLDGLRSARTDAEGRFAFPSPGKGEHRVEAILPERPGAYFTAPSAVTLPPGGEVSFTVAFSAARLSGIVTSDAGEPLAGVILELELDRASELDGTNQARAVTDSSGRYRFAAQEGAAQVNVVAESVPPGYELGLLAPRKVELAAAAPAVVDFTLRAQRSIAGTVADLRGETVTVAVLRTDRAVTTDESGRFVLRGLPAGALTLVVSSPRGEKWHRVEVPRGPISLTDLELVAR